MIGGAARSSPAAKAGLKAGDVIAAVNGNKITGSPELRLAIPQLSPGSVARVQIVRGGETVDVPVTVGEMPREAPLARQGG
jgi:serine protease Do